MKNPCRTLQNSIFEPLYSHEDELDFQPSKPIRSSFAEKLLFQKLSCPFAATSLSKKATMSRAEGTLFNQITPNDVAISDIADAERTHRPEHGHAVICTHSPHCSSSKMPKPSPIPTICPPSHSRSSGDVVYQDDGSVASKLLSSITKSLSSPSLLAYCKEPARETAYQKTLRLRKMKLQHCAEELGSESCEGSSLCDGDYIDNTSDSPCRMSSSQSTRQLSTACQKSEGNASSILMSGRSSPNLVRTSLLSKPTSPMKERSFPPPLSHTLARSASADSFSYSLRAYREEGRFVLKEVKVPCRQYFQANRKDGRLTLQCLTTDVDFESMQTDEAHKLCGDLQEGASIGVNEAAADAVSDKVSRVSCDKLEVEADNADNFVGRLEVSRVKECEKSERVLMDTDEREKTGCLYAERLLKIAFSNNSGKVNLISDAASASSVKSDFMAAKRKSGKASRTRFSKQQSSVHRSGKGPNLQVGRDVYKLSQCAGNLGFESESTIAVSIGGRKTLHAFELATASLQRSGYGVGKSASSIIKFEDVSATCSMENVARLVASFGLGKWSCGEQIKVRERDKSHGVMESSMGKGIINVVGVRRIEDASEKPTSGVALDVKCERSVDGGGAFEEAGNSECDVTRGCHSSSSSFVDVQLLSSGTNPAAQWLHTLHCKEIFDRNHLVKGAYMKLHCVA